MFVKKMKVIPKTGDAYKLEWKQVLLGWKIRSGILKNKGKQEVSFLLPVPEDQILVKGRKPRNRGDIK